MKNDIGIEQQLFVCDCGDVSHQFIVSWYPDDEDWRDMLYFQVHLNQTNGFWKRLWIAVQYLFGHRSNFGSFDEILLNKHSAKQLQEALNRFIAANEKKSDHSDHLAEAMIKLKNAGQSN